MTGLSRRERVRRCLARQPIDRFPCHTSMTAATAGRLARILCVAPCDLDARLDNHLLRVDLDSAVRAHRDGDLAFDWWGAGFDSRKEGYLVSVHPLSRATAERDLESYPWPDPEAPGLLDEARVAIADDTAGRFAVPNFGFALFERAWSLRGIENFYIDLAEEDGFAEALLERITDIQVALARRFVSIGVDGGYFGDDLGAQKGLLFSPATWRKLFKPRLARMFAVFREAGLPVIMHSDGDIEELLPDLVDIGLSCLNPVQPEVWDHAGLKRRFGNDLAFFGGLSTQETMPHGSPEEVVAESRRCLSTLGADGTGLLFGPSHRMMSDIPEENLRALADFLDELRGAVT